MKIALIQLDFHVGNFSENTSKIIKHINEAKSLGADLAVFPELAICGYPPKDFLEFKHFIELCELNIKEIAKQCIGIAAIVGSPTINPDPKGKDLYNSACFLKDGKIETVIHKTLLPTYDVFDEYRYFEPNSEFECIELNGCKIALTICEDLWNIEDNPLYRLNPMDYLVKEQPDFAVNIAASPFSFKHDIKRTEVLQKNASAYQIPFFYVNHTGAQTELIFDGGSTVVNAEGKIWKFPVFKESMQIFDLEEVKKGKNATGFHPKDKYQLIEEALVEGIGDYFQKLGLKKATLGLSGGIDSAVVFALTVLALGKENVLPVLMPSPYSTTGSVSDSMAMIDKLGTSYKQIPIVTPLSAIEEILIPVFDKPIAGLTEENLQARIRGLLLMTLTNELNLILLNTSNKSELAVGYSTMYGDSIGALAVLGDLYKTEVYALANHLNKAHGNIIPQNIITKPPSAELKPGQKDTDSLPPYDVLDAILFEYIENYKSPAEIIALGYNHELVYRILRMVNRSEFKRFQAPPVLRISEKAFGSGRRLPIVGKYLE